MTEVADDYRAALRPTLFTHVPQRTRSEDYCRQTDYDEDFHAGARIPQVALGRVKS